MAEAKTDLVAVGSKENLGKCLSAWKAAVRELRPSDQSTERLLRLALVAAEKNRALYNCTIESVKMSLFEAARLGVDPTGLLGQAYLIPYKSEAKLLIGYRGLLDLVQRGGGVSNIGCNLAHKDDVIEMREGLDPRLDHLRKHPGEIEWGDRQDCTGGYVVWTNTVDRSRQFSWMFLEQIERIRVMSKKPDSGPWREHWGAMARKTLLRHATKLMPMSTEIRTTIATALEREDEVIGLQDVEVEVRLPEDGRGKPGTKSPTEQPLVEGTRDG